MKSQLFLFSVPLMFTGYLAKTDVRVLANIKKYSTVWDAILYVQQMELFILPSYRFKSLTGGLSQCLKMTKSSCTQV